MGPPDLSPVVGPGSGPPGLKVGHNALHTVPGVELLDPGVVVLQLLQPVLEAMGHRPVIREPGKFDYKILRVEYCIVQILIQSVSVSTKTKI